MPRDQVHLDRSPGPLERALREAELKAVVADINRARASLDDAIVRRDDLIRTLYRHIGTRTLIKLTGLSRDRLYTIAGRPMGNGPSSGV